MKRTSSKQPARKKRARFPDASSTCDGHDYAPPPLDEEDDRLNSTKEQNSRPKKKRPLPDLGASELSSFLQLHLTMVREEEQERKVAERSERRESITNREMLRWSQN